MNKIVLDANVYVKLFKKEHDSQQAVSLINKLVKDRATIIEPHVVVNETIYVCELHKQDINEACDFFSALIGNVIYFADTDEIIIKESLQMTKIGHAKSGYPSFSDSMYHAIALRENALFITADNRHYEKTKHLGNIKLLKDI